MHFGAPFPKKMFHYIMIFSFCGVFLRLIFIDIRENRTGCTTFKGDYYFSIKEIGDFFQPK